MIAPEYNKIYGQAESMMTAVKNGVCGYLDLKNGIFVPTVYEEIICIGNDRLIVRKGEKHGVIDGNGSEVIPFEYNKLRAFKNGYAAAEMNGKWGYISEGGVKVTLFEYDYADDFCDGAAVIKKEKWYQKIFNTLKRILKIN